MPNHREIREPTKTMHEDDPVIVKRWNRFLTRQNVKRVAWVFTVITLALLLFNQAVVIDLYQSLGRQSQQLERERQDRISSTNEAICSLIGLVPPGNPRVDMVREKYQCGPFIPELGGPTSITPSPPAGSNPSASTPAHTITATSTETTTTTEITTASAKAQSTLTSFIPNPATPKATVSITIDGGTITRTITLPIQTVTTTATQTQTSSSVVTVTVTVPAVVCDIVLNPLC